MKILELIKNPPLLLCFSAIAAIIYGSFFLVTHHFPDYTFTPMQNIVFGWIIVALDTLFFIKGYIEFKKTKDKRTALFACCFFMAGLFEIPHIFLSYDGRLQLIPATFANISYALPAILSLFYFSNPLAKKDRHFFTKTLLCCMIAICVGTFILHKFITREIAQEFYSLSGTEMIFCATYFLTAIIYENARKYSGQKGISLLSIGYFLFFLNELSVYTHEYLISSYRLFIHIEMVLAIIFVLFGFSKLPITNEKFTTKLKSYISPYLFLFTIYVLILLLSSDAFAILVPTYLQFYFLSFFIILLFSD